MKLVALALLLAGCTDRIDGTIDYEVIGGFTNQGDGTRLAITLDGTAIRTTRTGGSVLELDPDTLERIDEAVYAAMLPHQVHYTSCCDMFTDVVIAHIGGEVRTVAIDRGAAGVPDPQLALVHVLQQVH